MDATWRAILWQQFGASIEMLENALVACPEELWGDRSQRPEFWYVVYHTLFWLDLYLSGSVEAFSPPAPFTLDEMDPRGLMPERVYTKDELQAYLTHGRMKCRATIEALTDEQARRHSVYGSVNSSFLELLLYNMRHVQHHAAQLNLILRQKTDSAPGWVDKAKS
ncbi:MAG TPA: DinB family protein [Pyrinomonadaceae bacterium]